MPQSSFFSKPNANKVLRDIAIVSALIAICTFVNTGLTQRAVITWLMISISLGILYYTLMVALPYLKLESGDIVYRSDYGFTHRVPISTVKRISIGFGVGGFESAIFIDDGERKLKVKSSYFDKVVLKTFISKVQENQTVELSPELEQYFVQ